ncbi:hypothetical protein HO133_008442 [Letharia lupina]|uniref:Uncharacterized protein n=1 Tax=Letharia lupina TaxID=560253 RepID=A0A8H6FG95_9LECA|nr:uncharacterized protein HO133_008442 [Letharia lupina]KAF6227001.1 hypothetical protein HO133_008442 [Letharia lupina]
MDIADSGMFGPKKWYEKTMLLSSGICESMEPFQLVSAGFEMLNIVLLAAGNDTASKTVLAVGALRHCGRIETSAHTLRIVALEPGGNFQGFTL